MASYVDVKVPKDLAEAVLDAVEAASKGGRISKGTNEATKAIERGLAKLVVIAEDVKPEEIVMHLPVLAREKKVPYVFVPTKQELGAAAGVSVSSAAVAVVDAGKAKKQLDEAVSRVEALGK